MRLSRLQRYIILQCYNRQGSRLNRAVLVRFYDNYSKKPKVELLAKIITRSLERLIDNGLLVGYGVRTTCKWFIKEVKLTRVGEKLGKRLLGEQMKLPFRKN